MDFNEQIKSFSKRISTIKDNILTEEATKMSLVVPVFQMLGYDVFNPTEFCPEYTADVGVKKGEKVDYAILENGQPITLIECKSCTEPLDKHSSQLFRYFATTTAKFGILTNGIVYRFYTDLEETNKMDLVPFLEIDMSSLKDSSINELKKFCKDNFDKDKIFSTAEELKYSSLIKGVLANEFDAPSDDFARFILSKMYDGLKTQKLIDKFIPVIKKSCAAYINELVNSKISIALSQAEEPDTEPEISDDIQEEVSRIITTDEEIEAFYIIKGMLAEYIPAENITHKDTESYFGILYKNNTRKPICRLNLNVKNKQLIIPDEDKNYTKIYIDSIHELYLYKQQLIDITKRYNS